MLLLASYSVDAPQAMALCACPQPGTSPGHLSLWLGSYDGRGISRFPGSAPSEPLPLSCPATRLRQEVRMVLDCVLQLLQEGQIGGLPRAQALLVLRGVAEGEGCIREGAGGHRRLRGFVPGSRGRGRPQGASHRQLPDQASTSPHLTLCTEPCPVPTQHRTRALCGHA